MIAGVSEVLLADLLTTVQSLADEDWRLVSITGVDDGEALVLLYHFDKDLELRHLRLRLDKGQVLPTISRIYYCAFVPENELQDFFGVEVGSPVVDYGGYMLLSHETLRAPLARRAAGEEVAR